MTQTFRIEQTLPNLNDYTKACRGNRYGGAAMKKRCEDIIAGYIRAAGVKPCAGPVYIKYLWVEQNKRRDLDNISSFGRKVINDSLVNTGILAGDGPTHIKGFSDEFAYDRDGPGVVVRVEEEEDA